MKDHIKPEYEAAANYGRCLNERGLADSGPNRTLLAGISRLRQRSRNLGQNDPQVSGAFASLAANIVGTGISPLWKLSDYEMKRKIHELWAEWVSEADFDETLNFYGLQTLVCREVIESGECLVRIIHRRPSDGLTVPLQLQVLEGDHLDHAYNAIAPNGNQVRMGIEYDRNDLRVAYWMYPEHPGESYPDTKNRFERIRIPASEILHIYEIERAGQQRGLPRLASAITTLHELNQYEDAELVRKKTAAMVCGFVTRPPEDAGMPSVLGNLTGADETGSPIINMEPGTIAILPPGHQVEIAKPVDVGGNYEQFVKHQERRVASALGLPYEIFSGDYSDASYQGLRISELEFQRRCRHFAYSVLVRQFCYPLAVEWLTQAVLAGAIDLPGYSNNPRRYWRIKWALDAWEAFDPAKNAAVMKGRVRNGFSSRAQEVAERGLDVEALDIEIEHDCKRADALGLVFDSDARRTDLAGRHYGRVTRP